MRPRRRNLAAAAVATEAACASLRGGGGTARQRRACGPCSSCRQTGGQVARQPALPPTGRLTDWPTDGGRPRVAHLFLACSSARAWPKWKRSKMPAGVGGAAGGLRALPRSSQTCGRAIRRPGGPPSAAHHRRTPARGDPWAGPTAQAAPRRQRARRARWRPRGPPVAAPCCRCSWGRASPWLAAPCKVEPASRSEGGNKLWRTGMRRWGWLGERGTIRDVALGATVATPAFWERLAASGAAVPAAAPPPMSPARAATIARETLAAAAERLAGLCSVVVCQRSHRGRPGVLLPAHACCRQPSRSRRRWPYSAPRSHRIRRRGRPAAHPPRNSAASETARTPPRSAAATPPGLPRCRCPALHGAAQRSSQQSGRERLHGLSQPSWNSRSPSPRSGAAPAASASCSHLRHDADGDCPQQQARQHVRQVVPPAAWWEGRWRRQQTSRLLDCLCMCCGRPLLHTPLCIRRTAPPSLLESMPAAAAAGLEAHPMAARDSARATAQAATPAHSQGCAADSSTAAKSATKDALQGARRVGGAAGI